MKRNWKSVLTMVGLGCLFIFSFYKFNQFTTKQMEYQVQVSLEDVSVQNIVNIRREVTENFKDLQAVSKKIKNFVHLNQEEIKEKVQNIENWGNYDFEYFGIANSDGVAYMSNGITKNIQKRKYFQQSIKGNKYIGNTVDKENIYSIPIYDKDQIIGIVFAIYHTKDLESLLTIESFHKEGYMYIVDKKSDVIVNSEKSVIHSNDNFFKDLLKDSKENLDSCEKMKLDFNKGRQGSIQYTFQNTKKYAHYMRLGIKDWWLITVVPYAVFDNRITPIVASTQVICGVSFLMVLICILLVYRKMNKNQNYLRQLAYIDSLTGGYNKTYLKSYWKSEIEKQTKKKSAILVFNIRKFRMVNEMYSSSVGDFLLKNVYFMIKRHLRRNGIVVHNQGDEFIILYHYTFKDEITQWIEGVMHELYRITYDNSVLKMKGTIGIYEIVDMNTNFDKMYDYANMARKNAKEKNNSYRFFNDTLRQGELNYKKQEDSIDKAMEEKEFYAWFQPKYDSKNKQIIGAEALARWKKKDGSLVPPNQFIPICEETGRILKLDRLIFDNVCMQLYNWINNGKKIVPISINVSRAYLENPEVLVFLKESIEKYQIPAQYIQLEITESSLIENEEMLENMIQKMHDIGFKVLLDDYGVGYSSLQSINSMNFDILKIDKSFIDTIGSEKGNSIVRHTIALASSLGMISVAEGVEEEKQYQFLVECGCDEIQGYYFSRPLPPEEFVRLL